MKKVILSIILVITFASTALLNAQEEKERMGLSLNGSIGMMNYHYTEKDKEKTETVAILRASPYISFPPFSVILDVNWILAPKEKRDKIKEKDTGKTPIILRAIEYDKKPVFARWGVLESVTLGNGFIMNNYTTASTAQSAAYTNKDKGAILSYEKPQYGFTALATYRQLYAGRGYYEIMDRLTVGATYVHDREAPGFEQFTVWGIDAKYSLFKNVYLYGDYAKIDKGDDGYMIGLNFIPTKRLSWRNEYRSVDKEFIPGLYDGHYEANKLKLKAEKKSILDIPDKTQKKGFCSKLSLDLGAPLKAYIAYEDYDKVEPRLIKEAHFKFETQRAKEGVIGFGGKIEGKITYEQKNFRLTKLREKQDEIITAVVKSPINPYTNLIVDYKRVYDEKGKPVETYKYEVEMAF